MLSPMFSSSSTGLEALLLYSPGSPRFSVAGRLSYSAAPPHSFFQSPPTSPQPEADIGLHSPRSLSDLSNARVTYSDLIASSQCFEWPSTPQLGAGPRVPVQHKMNGGKPSVAEQGVTSSPRKRLRRSLSGGRCASISQLLSSPSLSINSNAFEGIEICPINIFSPAAGVGLGLGLTMPPSLVTVPRSTDEFTIIPITEIAPGSLSSLSASPPESPAYSPNSSYASDSSESPSPITEFPPRFPAFNPPLSAAVWEPIAPASPTDAGQIKYEGLSHGLPSHMRGGARARLSSIPEEETDVKGTPSPTKLAQHAGLGLGLPSSLRAAAQQPASTSPKAPFKSRLQSTVQELFSTRKFAKRPLFSIPEARSREASAEAAKPEEKGKAKTQAGQQQQQERKPSARPHMSPAMRLAAESILEEDRKFRKKEGLDKVPKSLGEMSPTMRLVHEEDQKFRKQAGADRKSRFKFLF
ncbi:hypothetical protein DFH09DRAFT_1142903 [Mycena vulgaris]|nr:hypothetical protein DFH09DRAFT_1142903 [Mycena vulgaris]